jgi:hypothetical protein
MKKKQGNGEFITTLFAGDLLLVAGAVFAENVPRSNAHRYSTRLPFVTRVDKARGRFFIKKKQNFFDSVFRFRMRKG